MTPPHPDTNYLLGLINTSYVINGEQMRLHRDMGGRVYIVDSLSGKLVFKLYRSVHTDNALQSVSVIDYLSKNHYPVVSIIPTRNGDMNIMVDVPEGKCVGILYDYVDGQDIGFLHNSKDGTELQLHAGIESLGQQIGVLHRIMQGYNKPLIRRGREFFIERFITLLKRDHYDPCRIEVLEKYGLELWSHMALLPSGFCHGDLHTGNMLLTVEHQYVLYDFDIVSHAYPMIDVATLCDATNFNVFDEGSYDRTTQLFEEFYRGYRRERTLTKAEIAAIYDFIPIRHFELIATIVLTHHEDIKHPFIDEQYEWLLSWKELCARKSRQ